MNDTALFAAAGLIAWRSLREAIEARGDTAWLEEFESGIIVELKNTVFKDVPMTDETDLVDSMVSFTKMVFKRAREEFDGKPST